MPLNYAKTALLLFLMTGILVAMGGIVGGQTGLVVAFIVALVMNVLTLWKSDKMVLAMQGAEEVTAQSAPEFYGIVQSLAARAELPMPRVYVMHNPQPNAFATGRGPSSSAVCASTGLLEILSREEVAGVIAHELSHIKNRDTLTMTMAATIAGAISMLAQYLQVSFLFGGRGRDGGSRMAAFAAMLVAPFAAMLVQMAISRSREYSADRMGAMICGNPLWLASALQKIQTAVRGVPNPTAEAIPALAPLFIVNPLTGRGMDSLFSTHPATENRIAELEKMAVEMGQGVERRGPAQRPGFNGPWDGGTSRQPGPRGPWG